MKRYLPIAALLLAVSACSGGGPSSSGMLPAAGNTATAGSNTASQPLQRAGTDSNTIPFSLTNAVPYPVKLQGDIFFVSTVTFQFPTAATYTNTPQMCYGPLPEPVEHARGTFYLAERTWVGNPDHTVTNLNVTKNLVGPGQNHDQSTKDGEAYVCFAAANISMSVQPGAHYTLDLYKLVH